MDAEIPKFEKVESPKGPEKAPGADFGISGAEELERLRTEAEALKAEAETDPEAAKRLAVAEKRLELFMNEHDNAGAFKFKRFGREVRSMFLEEGEDGERPVEMDGEGRLAVAESQKDRRVLFVNMGELDRFNKEGGGHGAGDAALTEAAKAIERAVHAKLSERGVEGGYKMFRFSGNEFAVNIENISEEDFQDLMADIEAAKPSVPGVEEPAPLTATGFDFKEAVDIYNDLQSELGPEERVGNKEDAARELVDILKTRAYYDLDIHKFESRVRRVKDKVGSQGADATKPFFDNYMKKMFKDSPLEDLSAFEKLTDEDISRMAFEFARNNIQQQSAFESTRQDIVSSRLKRRRESGAPLGITGGSLEQALAIAARVADIPERTRGQKILDEMRGRNAEAQEGGDEHSAELADLEMQIESARRDAGTGLLERGVHYEELQEAMKEGKDTQLVFVDMGFLKYFDHKGGPEVGDAALKKAADLMEQAVEAAGVEATVYRYGGDEFTIRIDGGEDQMLKYMEALETIRSQAGAIPAGRKGMSEGYVPTELVFNYGAADTAFTDQVFDDMVEAGVFDQDQLSDPEFVAAQKADIMTTAADKAIEEQKAVGRFELLIGKLRDGECQSDELCRTQTEQMITYSQKAIFGEKGGDALLRSWAESGKSMEELRGEIAGWVEKQGEKATVEDAGKRDLLSELVEAHAKIRYFERKLRTAEAQNAALTEENSDLRAEMQRLAEEKRLAEEERQKIIDARKNLSG